MATRRVFYLLPMLGGNPWAGRFAHLWGVFYSRTSPIDTAPYVQRLVRGPLSILYTEEGLHRALRRADSRFYSGRPLTLWWSCAGGASNEARRPPAPGNRVAPGRKAGGGRARDGTRAAADAYSAWHDSGILLASISRPS